MSDEFEEQEWVRVGVAAALSKQYAADQQTFLEELAQMLTSALPDEAEIQRSGGLFSRKTVHKITVPMGEFQYHLELPGRGGLAATRHHVVRGIVLKKEEIPVPQWVDEVSAALEERARTNAAARDALEKLIG